jgi:hypothetical protein
MLLPFWRLRFNTSLDLRHHAYKSNSAAITPYKLVPVSKGARVVWGPGGLGGPELAITRT